MNFKCLQSPEHEDESQRYFLGVVDLKPPEHVNGEEQNEEVEGDVDDGKGEIETSKGHAFDGDGPVPPAIDRHAQKDRRHGFREPPGPDQSEEYVHHCPKPWRCEDAPVHKEGSNLDGRRGGDIDLVKGVDRFQKADLIRGGDGLDMLASSVDDTCNAGQLLPTG